MSERLDLHHAEFSAARKTGLPGVMTPFKISEQQHPFMGTRLFSEIPSKGIMDPGSFVQRTVFEKAESKGIRKRLSNAAKATGLTIVSLAGTEGAAHVGGTASAATPDVINPLNYIHGPTWSLAIPVGLSYAPWIASQWRTIREAGKREDAGEPTYNILATGLRKLVRDRFPKLEAAALQFGGAIPQVILEGWYWGGAILTDHVTSVLEGSGGLEAGASFMIGANLGAATWNSYQTDTSEYLREQGKKPRRGMGVLLDVSQTLLPVTRIKVERNITRVRNFKDKVVARFGEERIQQEEVTVFVETPSGPESRS